MFFHLIACYLKIPCYILLWISTLFLFGKNMHFTDFHSGKLVKFSEGYWTSVTKVLPEFWKMCILQLLMD